MLAPFAPFLQKTSIVLASQSPRRRAIFQENLGLVFEVVVSGFAEDVDKSACADPSDYVAKTSRIKAESVVEELTSKGRYVDIIVSADTIVVCDADILEKPKSKLEAFDILKRLSGREHMVLTAVTIAVREGIKFNSLESQTTVLGQFYSFKTFVESTTVQFKELEDATINAYIETGEPMDKAGAYGIQSLGSSFVTEIRGCYFNVVGFPVHRFCIELIAMIS